MTRGSSRGAEARLAFEALSIEGGLLSPEWLAKVAQLAAGGQGEADYRVPKGLVLRDEIGRFWRVAQAHWAEFAEGRRSGGDPVALAERFVPALLSQAFGFALTATEPAVVAERSYPIGRTALGGRVPVVVAPAGAGLDAPSTAFGDGGRRRSAFGLAQEFLNAADGALWGLASDGLVLRVLRDNASLTRPAWIEADLGRIFEEERYADFAALWLLAHESRFGRPDRPPAECDLERWREAGREEGTRAREDLRRGVEEALLALGQGFLAHPDNTALRQALHDGTLTKEGYFQQLLRLVYRLIFLLTVEERGLLHPDGTSEAVRARYAEGYAVRRLRERSVKRSAHDRHGDAWEALKIVFRGVADGEERLGLPALAGIFARSRCPALDAARLENRHLLLAVFKLSWIRESAGLSRVNWRDMGPEELGSVYESLLELVPQVREDGRAFGFASGGEAKGHARKTTGSYYTPDSLVQVLLDSALEPVIGATIAANPGDPAGALLGLSIVDPACGSGHFLLAAARRLAAHVARLQANGTPSAAQYRHALRQVVGRCVYGVDLNPMAVELCQVALWMEAVEPGLPLTFLDAHVRHGNALLGTTPELMAGGIPDAAWEPIEGDDRKVASALKKRNKAERAGQEDLAALWGGRGRGEADAVAREVAAVEAAADESARALAEKEARWAGVLGSEGYRHQKFVADAWCAAFVWPKVAGESVENAPTHGAWGRVRDGGVVPGRMREIVEEVAGRYRFFHWHLAFPGVFARGGFDVVLGNPPWERVKLTEKEWFASRDDRIATEPNAAKRKAQIDHLRTTDPKLHEEFEKERRVAEGTARFVVASKRFPRSGVGDVNTYALFTEADARLVGTRGRVGIVVPSGIATDSSCKAVFQDLVEGRRLITLYDFENSAPIFPTVHRSFRFSLVVMTSLQAGPERARFVFFARATAELLDADRVLDLGAADIVSFNPVTRTCPIFKCRRDLQVARSAYRRLRFIGDRDSEPTGWRLQVPQGLYHQTNDAALLVPWSDTSVVPTPHHALYEGRMIQQFDHRAETAVIRATNAFRSGGGVEVTDHDKDDPLFTVGARYLVPVSETENRLPPDFHSGWFLVFKDVTAATNERTMIAAIIPRVGVVYSLRVVLPVGEQPAPVVVLLAEYNSVPFDYLIRQKTGGLHITDYVLRQTPVLDPPTYEADTPWARGTVLRDWLLPRVLELTYTAWDLEPFAKDVGWAGPPFRWDPARRFLLRAELDAAFFHLYGIEKADVDYIMDTFPIVRKNDEKAHGEYRTKRVILEVYDAMADAARTGVPYATRLAPPPADPAVAHPPR